MSGLTEPPKQAASSRLVVRFFVLIVFLLALGTGIWTAVTLRQIDRTEDIDTGGLLLENPIIVNGTTINVVTETGGPVPVILLHDVDPAGGVLWDAVAGELGSQYRAVRIDLPGFGLSDRLPTEGPEHTVASMAQVVADVIEARSFGVPVVIAGVGLGGEVGAEVAVTNPDLVRGLVLIDVDFWEGDSWLEIVRKLPLVGRAATFTFETGGVLAPDRWAPNCGSGGWCATADQSSARDLAVSIVGTTDSLRSLLRTPPSSLVPSDLAKIGAPVVYVWSTRGDVPEESVDRVMQELPEMTLTTIDVWQAHLESPSVIVDAIGIVGR